MENEKKWYVVYTKPKWERKVADLLEKKKLNSYYPRFHQVQYWQEKRKVINVPLFTSLVFVQASEEDHQAIKQIDGVSGILYWISKPAVINDDEISSMRYFLEQYTNIRLEKIQVSAGEDANIEKSRTHVHPSGIVSFSNVHTVSLPSLGYTLISESIVEDAVKSVA